MRDTYHSLRVEAVVLRHSDYGEADRILISRHAPAWENACRSSKACAELTSRKAGHLEPFTHVKLQLATGRALFIVSQADTIDAYLPLREDLLLTSHASYVIELLDRFTYEDNLEHPALFRLLTETLSRLASSSRRLAGDPLL